MNKNTLLLIGILILFIFCALLTTQSQPPQNKVTAPVPAFFNQKPGIAVLYIYGPISVQSQQNFLTDNGLDGFISQLYRIEKNEKVKALVIRIDSPGGTVGASQEIYNELIKFKQRTQIPVIVSIADLGASGAYWAAAASDYIFANPGSLVGNIGVIIGNLDLTAVPKKYGIGYTLYKSGPFKDLLSSWRTATPADKQIIQDLIQEVHIQFIHAVSEGRKMDINQVKKLADGRIFTGSQGKKNGLIDELGGFRDAIAYANQAAGLQGEPNILYKSSNPLRRWLSLINNDSKLRLPFSSTTKVLAQ